jgi:hypothetical protein
MPGICHFGPEILFDRYLTVSVNMTGHCNDGNSQFCLITAGYGCCAAVFPFDCYLIADEIAEEYK